MDSYFHGVMMFLVVAIVCAHVFAFVMKKSRVGWLVVQYLTTGLGGVGLIAATISMQGVAREIDRDKALESLKWQSGWLQDYANTGVARYAVWRSDYVTARKGSVPVSRACVAILLKLQVVPINRTLVTAAQSTCAFAIPHAANETLYVDLTKDIERLSESFEDYEPLSKPYTETSGERRLRLGGPLFAAIALALALARVTASAVGYV